jgi:hypothetical protein
MDTLKNIVSTLAINPDNTNLLESLFGELPRLGMDVISGKVIYHYYIKDEKWDKININDILAMLAKNPNTPDYVLGLLIEHNDEDIRLLVVLNESTPSWVLAKALEDEDDYIRIRLAWRLEIPFDEFERRVKQKTIRL